VAGDHIRTATLVARDHDVAAVTVDGRVVAPVG
jgi:hypothetical protein